MFVRLRLSQTMFILYLILVEGTLLILSVKHETMDDFKFIRYVVLIELLFWRTKNVDDFDPYYSNFYKSAILVKTYEILITPMPDMKNWRVPKFVDKEVLPSKYKIPLEKSKKGRHKKSSETLPSSTNYCGRCGHAGHNCCNYELFSKDNWTLCLHILIVFHLWLFSSILFS